MTDRYMRTSGYLEILQDMVHDLTSGVLSTDVVRRVLITPEEGVLFEVFYFDRQGKKIGIYTDAAYECWTYYYRVKPV